jgi:hypothetical protein
MEKIKELRLDAALETVRIQVHKKLKLLNAPEMVSKALTKTSEDSIKELRRQFIISESFDTLENLDKEFIELVKTIFNDIYIPRDVFNVVDDEGDAEVVSLLKKLTNSTDSMNGFNTQWPKDITPVAVGDEVMLTADQAIMYLAMENGKTLGHDFELDEKVLEKYSCKKAVVEVIDIEFPFNCGHCTAEHVADTKIVFAETGEEFYCLAPTLTKYIDINIEDIT